MCRKQSKRTDLRGNNETILVAEDNEEVRQITKSYLQDFGYAVLEAADGEEAVEIYRKNADKIAVVILDVIMPKKNGKEALLEMKKNKPRGKGDIYQRLYRKYCSQKGHTRRRNKFSFKTCFTNKNVISGKRSFNKVIEASCFVKIRL